MSFSRSPRHNAIRRREELADRRKVTTFIAIVCAILAFAYVGALVLGLKP